MNRFSNQPKDASLAAIYGQAGKIFEEQINRDTQTDYTRKEAFNQAIWYIAEEAQRQDFINLRGKLTKEIAQEMGDYISNHLRTSRGWRLWQR